MTARREVRVTRTVAFAVLAASLTVLSGCGGAAKTAGTGTSTTVTAAGTTSTAGGSGSKTATGGSVAAQALAVGREYARCARSNGAPGFPDPQVDQYGTVSFPGETPGETKADIVKVEGPCGAILNRLPPAQIPTRTPAQMRSLRSFSTCMRSHPAAKTFPDPNPDGVFPIKGTIYDRDTGGYPSVAQQRAWNACWHFVEDGGGWRSDIR
jgi:hypothetical protein